MPKARSDQIAYLAQVLEITADDATKMVEKLEAGSQTLVDLGVNWKEVTPPADETPVTEETVVEVTEPPAPEPVTAAAAVEVGTSEVPAADIDIVLAPDTVSALAQQVLTSVETTFSDLRAKLDLLAQSFNDLLATQNAQTAAQKQLEVTVLALKEADDVKLAQLVKDLPRGVLVRGGGVERPSQRPSEAVAAKEESMLARGKATLFG